MPTADEGNNTYREVCMPLFIQLAECLRANPNCKEKLTVCTRSESSSRVGEWWLLISTPAILKKQRTLAGSINCHHASETLRTRFPLT
jgi:hypothetical protein